MEEIVQQVKAALCLHRRGVALDRLALLLLALLATSPL
jgi:hypothetical protein